MRVENAGAKDFSEDFRYESDGFIQSIFRKFYEYVSIDYLSPERQIRHPFLNRFMENRYFRIGIRCVIIPIRAFIYWWIKLMNLLNLRRLIREMESKRSFK